MKGLEAMRHDRWRDADAATHKGFTPKWNHQWPFMPFSNVIVMRGSGEAICIAQARTPEQRVALPERSFFKEGRIAGAPYK